MDDFNKRKYKEINAHNIKLMEKYRLLAENTVECIWLFDLANDCFKYISPSVTPLRGISVEDAMKEKLADSLTPDSLEKVERLTKMRLPKFLNGDRSAEVVSGVDEFQQYCQDGTIKDIEISTKYIFNEATGSVDILGVSRDITERKKLEKKLNNEIKEKNESIKKLRKSEKELAILMRELTEKNEILKNIAVTDELTGVYNRYFLDKRIEEEMLRADLSHEPLSLIIFDLDHFKRINDTWGHDIGDKVLIKTAMIVSGYVKEPNMLIRWGGEEFAVLMPNTTIEDADILAEKLRTAIIAKPYLNTINITASFGTAERLAGEDFNHWFKRVDYALYRAKNEGRNCVISCKRAEIAPIALIRLEWKAAWECGNNLIDDQHKTLLELANGLMDLSLTDINSKNVSDQFYRLLDHIANHFNDEVQILQKVGYPQAEEHAGKHKALVEEALKLKEKFLSGKLKSAALFSFLVDEVVMGHLLTDDVLFFPYTKGEV